MWWSRVLVVVFFVTQKTAYEMRISDWSSDVCSSDLKRNIFIGFSAAFIRLSSYFKYNNDTLSEEEFRKKVNRNLTGKNMIGYSQDFELLEDVKDPFRRLINEDTAFIYDSKFTYNFKDTVDNYGCLVVHLVQFDLGYVGFRYFYPLDDSKKMGRE